MHDTPAPRRARAAPPVQRYRALVTLTYPATEADAIARRDRGQRDHPWAKANPGDVVPDWVIELSPGLFSKGRVELIHDERDAVGEEG